MLRESECIYTVPRLWQSVMASIQNREILSPGPDQAVYVHAYATFSALYNTHMQQVLGQWWNQVQRL